jgi:hypothetical protein
MNKIAQLKIRLAERNLENFADPPDDPLGELSDWELGLRRFCYQYDHKVTVEVGETRFNVFLDPDICILLKDISPEQIGDLEQGKIIRLDFAEIYHITIIFTPVEDKVNCLLREFSYSHEAYNYLLNKQQVLDELKLFLTELMELAVNMGYISLEDKEEFIKQVFVPLQMLV